MDKMVKITAVRSDGRRFSYENDDWGILSVDGIDFPGIEIFTKHRGFGHGDIVTGKRKSSREIIISASEKNYTPESCDRESAIGFHNANYKFNLIIKYLNLVRIAKDCEIKLARYPTGNVYDCPEFAVTYLSPHADLFADSSELSSFVTTKALWHDTRIYKGTGLAFGEISKTSEIILNYLGSEPCPVNIKINASGYVDGIKVAVGGKTLNIDISLYSGDVLIIDGENREIRKNGNLIPESSYDMLTLIELRLRYGDNTVLVDSEGNTAFTAELTYTGRYGGL